METFLSNLSTADASCTIESRGREGARVNGAVSSSPLAASPRGRVACSISTERVEQLDDAAREVGLNLPLFEFEGRRSSTHSEPSSNGDGEAKKET